MTRARVVHCPDCGGDASEQDRICKYCGAPIATVRCAHCYHMNIPDAVHCSGCGRQLGLEPVGEPDELRCPDCDRPFEAFSGGPGRLHDCPSCGGQFVEHALLRDLLEQREVYGQVAPRAAVAQNPLRQPVRYIPCPACGALMNRTNFGRASGVIVDVCQKHGIWFDAGELPRVLAFVEAGGLRRARQREQEEARLERQSLAARLPPPSAAGSAPIVGLCPTAAVERQLWEDLADAGSALLGFLADALRRD